MMLVSKEVDRAFYEAIAGKPDEWKMRAIAGLTTREFYGGDPRTHEWAKNHGLSRANLPSEREAWLFGWEWPDMALLRARATLLDLLMGRVFRHRAERTFWRALELQSMVDSELDFAAHQERVAGLTERGQILWGQRMNRCGMPEVVDDDG